MGSTLFGLVDMGLLGSPMGLLGSPSLIPYFILINLYTAINFKEKFLDLWLIVSEGDKI